jgi:hypothetical protein
VVENYLNTDAKVIYNSNKRIKTLPDEEQIPRLSQISGSVPLNKVPVCDLSENRITSMTPKTENGNDELVITDRQMEPSVKAGSSLARAKKVPISRKK